MQKVNLFKFYVFGSDVRNLRTIREGDNVLEDTLPILFNAQGALEDLRNLPSQPLTATKQSLEELSSKVDKLVTRLIEGMEKSPIINKRRALEITNMGSDISKFETIFEAEVSSLMNTYSVSRVGAYDSYILIEEAELALSEPLRNAMSDLARYDLNQSGKCLAFEVPTAAGFHALRAVEAVIKQYYEKLAGQPWPHTQRDWGKYIDKLRDLGAPSKIINALQQTKDSYRNPLMHPEDILNKEEALGLFEMVLHILRMILQEIVN